MHTAADVPALALDNKLPGTPDLAIQLTGITKRFPGVLALDDVDLEVRAGEVHALVGENGAGKSTLLNVLGGVVQPDSGIVRILGANVRFHSPADAQRRGIAFIHQELSLFPNLDVTTNIFIGALPSVGPGIVRTGELDRRVGGILARVGLSHVSPRTLVERLRPGQQQLVEIARCLARRTSVLILDEPTSSLTGAEVETLFGIIRELKVSGVTIVYVSHRLNEVFDIADRITVLRDGRRVGTVASAESDRRGLIRMILGHDMSPPTRGAARPRSEKGLVVRGITRGSVVRDVTFSVARGEVLAITGLLGSGRTELLRCLFGLDRRAIGRIEIEGRRVQFGHPDDAIRAGIAFITENRREEGLLGDRPVRDNIVLASLRQCATRIGWVSQAREATAAERQRTALQIATPNIDREVRFLSGGNQQKVVLGKWLETHPKVLILDEPTRGIDVGAKEEVYAIVGDLAARGTAILLVSSELPEVVRLADRALVMRNGAIAAEFARDEMTTETLLMAATGGGAE